MDLPADLVVKIALIGPDSFRVLSQICWRYRQILADPRIVEQAKRRFSIIERVCIESELGYIIINGPILPCGWIHGNVKGVTSHFDKWDLECTYVNGRINGKFVVTNKRGIVRYEMNYRDGFRDGEKIQRREDGSVWSHTVWKHDILVKTIF